MLKLLKVKIPSISGLATNATLTAVENEIRNISSFVKKTDFNTKISEIEKKLTDHNHDKYITTPEFNKFIAEDFAARLAKVNLVTKTDFDTKLKSLNQKVNSNKTKCLHVESKLKKLQTFQSIYFRGNSHVKEDGTQNYLEFQPIYTYKKVAGVGIGNYIYFWKSKGLSDENITAPTTTNYNFNPQLSYLSTKTRV